MIEDCTSRPRRPAPSFPCWEAPPLFYKREAVFFGVKPSPPRRTFWALAGQITSQVRGAADVSMLPAANVRALRMAPTVLVEPRAGPLPCYLLMMCANPWPAGSAFRRSSIAQSELVCAAHRLHKNIGKKATFGRAIRPCAAGFGPRRKGNVQLFLSTSAAGRRRPPWPGPATPPMRQWPASAFMCFLLSPTSAPRRTQFRCAWPGGASHDGRPTHRLPGGCARRMTGWGHVLFPDLGYEAADYFALQAGMGWGAADGRRSAARGWRGERVLPALCRHAGGGPRKPRRLLSRSICPPRRARALAGALPPTPTWIGNPAPSTGG